MKNNISSILTKEFLNREYVENKRFAKDISVEVGCSLVTVTNYLRKYGIEIKQRYDLRQKFQGLNPAREIMTEKYLRKEYLEKERSLTNIARELNCSSSLVKEMLQVNGIDIRDRSKYQKNMGESNGFYNGGITNDRGYLIIKLPNNHLASHDGYVRLHDLLAEYYFNHILQDNEVVHHKNEDKQDNRKCNLEIMEKESHDRLHALKRWDKGNFRKVEKVR